MKLLFITRHYLNEKNGGSLCSRANVYAFASLFSDFSIIYPTKYGIKMEDFIPVKAKLFGCDDSRSKIRKGLDIYRGRLHRFVDYVKEHLTTHQYDIIVLDHSLVGAGIVNYIHSKTNSKIITIHHNIEHKYNEDNKQMLLFRYPYNYYANKAERETLNFSNLNLTLTKLDADYFAEWNKNINKYPIECLGNFETPDAPVIFDKYQGSQGKGVGMVISGSMNFPQTVDAIVNFLTIYYPVAKKISPLISLVLTGRNPAKKIKDLCRNDSTIKIVESPDDIFEVIKDGNLYVSPIFGGSGVKLRVMDGLRLGLPVLCHENSANGYETIMKAGYMFTYHDVSSFESSYTKLIHTKFEKKNIYESYRQTFSFEAGVKRLRDILKKHNLIDL